MRFSVAAVFAGAAVVSAGMHGKPTDTEYSTSYYTVTSCPPTVTSCPEKSTVVSSSVYYTSTVYSTKVHTVTSCPEEKTECPLKHTKVVTDVVPISTTVCPLPTTTPSHNKTSEMPFYPTATSKPKVFSTGVSPKSSSEEACPTVSVKTIHTSVTTVVPTVIYETVSVPCPTSTVKVVPSAGTGAPRPSSTASPTGITAGAGSIGGSVLFAAAAGLVAVVMA